MFGRSRQFKLILQEKWHDLYRVAYTWTHDRNLAADLVQETITRCLKNTEKFTQVEDVTIWLFTVLRNCWRDHLRKNKPQVEFDFTELVDSMTPELNYYQNQLKKQLAAAFGRLSHEHREILSLVAIEGFSYETVAKILGIPTGTVMSRISRARQSLKEQLSELDLPDATTSTLWRVK